MSSGIEVRLARNSGFCFGVKRAINMAMKSAPVSDNIVTLGPIIHNPQMVEKLKSHGIDYVDSADQIPSGATVIIRSHGVTRQTMEELRSRDLRIIDATCPYVSKTFHHAEELKKQGFAVMILGDAKHPEVIALKSYVNGDAEIVASASEFPERTYRRLGIVSQTTQSVEKFQELVCRAIPCCDEIHLIKTICNATNIRQDSTLQLAKKSDLMIVIGGRNSSNTKMLARISGRCAETHHIETAQEINPAWFAEKKHIGITAGASTPDWIIIDVYNVIKENIGARDLKAMNVEDIPGYKEE